MLIKIVILCFWCSQQNNQEKCMTTLVIERRSIVAGFLQKSDRKNVEYSQRNSKIDSREMLFFDKKWAHIFKKANEKSRMPTNCNITKFDFKYPWPIVLTYKFSAQLNKHSQRKSPCDCPYRLISRLKIKNHILASKIKLLFHKNLTVSSYSIFLVGEVQNS